MKCTECNEKVKDNTKYSIHMNRKHRGTSYTPLEFNKSETSSKSYK